MNITIVSREGFTLDAYVRVAWGRESTLFGYIAMTRMTEAWTAFITLIGQDPDAVTYSVTSGNGQRANLRFIPDQRRAHAARSPKAAVSAFGDPLPN